MEVEAQSDRLWVSVILYLPPVPWTRNAAILLAQTSGDIAKKMFFTLFSSLLDSQLLNWIDLKKIKLSFVSCTDVEKA